MFQLKSNVVQLELSSKGDFDKPTLIPNIKEPTNKNDLIFISYAREDSQYANRLYNDLKNAGLTPG